MNYKKIIDALVVLNKNAKSISGLEALNFNKVSQEFKNESEEFEKNSWIHKELKIQMPHVEREFLTLQSQLLRERISLKEYEEEIKVIENEYTKIETPFRLISLYTIKNMIIKKLIAHGQLQTNSYHSFTRGGLSKSIKSKFAKKDDSGKVIGEFHNSLCKYHKAFAGLKYDGILASHQDKTQGFYQNKMDLAQSIYILSEFIDNDNFSKSKEKKYNAIAKRRNYL